MKRGNTTQTYGGCYSFHTADERADSQKRKDLNKRPKDVLKAT
jgi:hypothetical protein